MGAVLFDDRSQLGMVSMEDATAVVDVTFRRHVSYSPLLDIGCVCGHHGSTRSAPMDRGFPVARVTLSQRFQAGRQQAESKTCGDRRRESARDGTRRGEGISAYLSHRCDCFHSVFDAPRDVTATCRTTCPVSIPETTRFQGQRTLCWSCRRSFSWWQRAVGRRRVRCLVPTAAGRPASFASVVPLPR